MILNTYYHDFTSKFWIDTTSFWIIIDWALLARQILLCDYWLYLTGSNLRKCSRQLYLQYLKSCDTDSSCSVIMNTLFLPVVLQSKILSLIFTSVFYSTLQEHLNCLPCLILLILYFTESSTESATFITSELTKKFITLFFTDSGELRFQAGKKW